MMKLKKGIKPVTDYRPLGNRRGLPQYLYHATKIEYLESIKDFGLVRGLLKGVPGWYKDIDFIWLDTKTRGLRNWLKTYYPDWSWIIVRVNTDYLETNKLYRKKFKGHMWFLYRGDVPPEAIHIVG